MTPPTSRYGGRGDRTKKDFSPNLGAIDSEAPVSPNPGATWDTETDHILSFFLGGDAPQHGHSMPDFATSHPKSGDHMEDESDAEGGGAPPTPAVNFYAPHAAAYSSTSYLQQQQQPPMPGTSMTSSSSSSSLGSMAATLVGGGPMVFHQHLQPRNSSPLGGVSPISPAALIGSGQENLMLPPPQRGGQPQNTSSLPPQTDRERHLAWLRDLNAMAKAAGSGSMPPPNMAPPQPHHHVGPPYHPMATGMMFHPSMMPPPQQQQQPAPPPAAESAEKRAKRLERNRESARKSRRRKKERLATLEAQVNKLHADIEAARRQQINAMVPSLRACRQGTEEAADWSRVVAATGPDSEIARSVVEFQHNALKQLVFPRYQKLLVWLTLHDESFFTAGKEDYASREQQEAGGKGLRASSAKLSSKQIGDELVNGPKGEETAKKRVTFKDKEQKKEHEVNLTPYANDSARVWPLLCYELSFSVDQEERFVATHKRVQDRSDLGHVREQMAAAVQMADSLREAVESLSQVVADREQRSLCGILEPAQVSGYYAWLASNRERCDEVVAHRDMQASVASESSLQEICRKLHEVLQISKTEK